MEDPLQTSVQTTQAQHLAGARRHAALLAAANERVHRWFFESLQTSLGLVPPEVQERFYAALPDATRHATQQDTAETRLPDWCLVQWAMDWIQALSDEVFGSADVSKAAFFSSTPFRDRSAFHLLAFKLRSPEKRALDFQDQWAARFSSGRVRIQCQSGDLRAVLKDHPFNSNAACQQFMADWFASAVGLTLQSHAPHFLRPDGDLEIVVPRP